MVLSPAPFTHRYNATGIIKYLVLDNVLTVIQVRIKAIGHAQKNALVIDANTWSKVPGDKATAKYTRVKSATVGGPLVVAFGKRG